MRNRPVLTLLAAAIVCATRAAIAQEIQLEPPCGTTLQLPSPDYVAKVNHRATRVGLGIDMGLWGTGFGQGVKADIPFGSDIGRYWGMRLRYTMAQGAATNDFDSVMFGGLELFGRSPVMLGLIRVYGGGGVYAGARPSVSDGTRRAGVSGGGHMGIEVMSSHWMSFTLEVGGQGPVHVHRIDAGPSIMGGMMFYL